MSEIDLSTLPKNDDCKTASELQTPMQEINSALKECGFGWFHVRILCASFFGLSLTTTAIFSVSYILPEAECDLKMDMKMKGLLNGSFFIGSIASGIVSGFLVDTFGRKLFLVGGFGLLTFFNLVSAVSQTYNMLIISKICEGILLGVTYSPTISYTAEFCHSGIRDRLILTQASFVPISQVLFAIFSWGILVNDWYFNLFNGFVVLNTWNIYLLMITIFAFMACILYSFLPESPKYLILNHKYDEARKILCYVYKTNTRKPIESFSYANLWKEKELAKPEDSNQKKISLGHQLTVGLYNVKLLFQKPHINHLLLFSVMIFCDILLFNFIRMWYPQLSTIVEHYATEDNQELCTMLDAYTHNLRQRNINTTSVENCVPVRSGRETYINNVILGAASVPSFIISVLIVNRIGKKPLLIAAGLLSIGVTLGLRWSNSKALIVTFFAAGMSISQIMKSLLEASAMHYFPTSIRTLGFGVQMTLGRVGSLVSNIVFPLLLDISAVIPFYTFTGFMVVVTLLATIHPAERS